MTLTAQTTDDLVQFGLSVEYTTGLFVALLTGPQLVEQHVWMRDLTGSFTSAGEAQRIMCALADLYDVVRDGLDAGNPKLVPEPDETEAIAAFSAGYLAAMRLQPEWLEDTMGVMMASPLQALAIGRTTDSEARRQDHRERLLEHLIALYQYWEPARENPGRPVVTAAPRVGRNDRCPCGSGKKYKKCCAARAQGIGRAVSR